jgi:hypothetical protein
MARVGIFGWHVAAYVDDDVATYVDDDVAMTTSLPRWPNKTSPPFQPFF